MSNLLIDNQDSTRIITINRPDKLNALNRETIKELGEEIAMADADKDVKSIIAIT